MSEQTSIDSIRAEIESLQEQLTAKKAEMRALRGSTTRAKAEPKLCADGCGEMTRGGDWLPGHDARFRSRMLKAIDNGDEDAIAELMARPTLLHGASEGDLRARLGSETRKRDAAVARQVEAEKVKTKPVTPAPKPNAKPRVDKVEQQQGTKSPTVTRNGAAIRLAQRRAA